MTEVAILKQKIEDIIRARSMSSRYSEKWSEFSVKLEDMYEEVIILLENKE